jgi:hypothetical protein
VFAAVFVALYVGHSVGDHIAQTDRQAAGKAAAGWLGVRAMAGHLSGYHLCIALCLAALLVIDVPLQPGGVLAGLSFSAASHGFIDRRWPVRALLRRVSPASAAGPTAPQRLYQVDQSLHLGCLFVSALLIVLI